MRDKVVMPTEYMADVRYSIAPRSVVGVQRRADCSPEFHQLCVVHSSWRVGVLRDGLGGSPHDILGDMTIQRIDNVGIVVDDLDAAVAFFTELGMELEGRMPIATSGPMPWLAICRIRGTQPKLQRVAPGVSPVLTPKATDGLTA
jgi:hypothetical protein